MGDDEAQIDDWLEDLLEGTPPIVDGQCAADGTEGHLEALERHDDASAGSSNECMTEQGVIPVCQAGRSVTTGRQLAPFVPEAHVPQQHIPDPRGEERKAKQARRAREVYAQQRQLSAAREEAAAAARVEAGAVRAYRAIQDLVQPSSMAWQYPAARQAGFNRPGDLRDQSRDVPLSPELQEERVLLAAYAAARQAGFNRPGDLPDRSRNVPFAPEMLQCETNPLCTRGYKHMGKGGHCLLKPPADHFRAKQQRAAVSESFQPQDLQPQDHQPPESATVICVERYNQWWHPASLPPSPPETPHVVFSAFV